MKHEFGPEAYRACTKAVSISLCETKLSLSEADDELNSSSLISNSKDHFQVFQTNIQPYMKVNNIEIGRATVPSELIRVTHQGRSLFVQILYDKGSQITLLNQYCSPLVVDSKKNRPSGPNFWHHGGVI